METQDDLLNEYNRLRQQYDAFRVSLQSLIQDVLREDAHVIHVESRLKTFDSLAAKLKRKDFKILSEVSDLVGIRITVDDPAHISVIRDTLNRELTVDMWSENDTSVNPQYKKIHLTVGLDSKRSQLPEWESYKELRAEVQVETTLANAWDGLQHLASYGRAGKDGGKDLVFFSLPTGLAKVDELDEIINEFERLLEKPDVHEKRDIHKYIDQHQFLLNPNPEEMWSEIPLGLGTQMQMDFMFRESDGEYVLVEIENPRHRLFTQDGDFRYEVNHAHRQVEDWQEWIEDNIATVQKAYPGIISPRGLVVIGRSRDLSESERRSLNRRNINLRGRLKIITYDELIRTARTYVSLTRKRLQS
jgi:ppGpp synthetase/RelA/SpoT-type nucleotidyltranferase